MKKAVTGMLALGFLLACSDGKVDEKKINDAGEKLQKAVQKGADSLVTKAGRLTDSLVKKDTTR